MGLPSILLSEKDLATLSDQELERLWLAIEAEIMSSPDITNKLKARVARHLEQSSLRKANAPKM